jgi:hypothetical protein
MKPIRLGSPTKSVVIVVLADCEEAGRVLRLNGGSSRIDDGELVTHVMGVTTTALPHNYTCDTQLHVY